MLNILFICTGNICRSPMAAQMLEQRLEAAGISGVAIASAGVGAMVGRDLDVTVAGAMQEMGFKPAHHVAQQVTEDLIREADLILTATVDHRTDVVELAIPANRYTFTLKEFAAVARYMVESGANASITGHDKLIAETKQLRGYGQTVTNLDIADPYRLGPDAARVSAAETLEAIEWLAKWLS